MGLEVMEEFCGCGIKHCRCTLLSFSWGNFLCVHLHLKLELKIRLLETFNFYLIMRI